ncbi:MAG: protein translocase subunit SecF [Actinomycetota bacterium]
MSGILRKFYEGETKIDFIGKRKIWFLISAGLVLISLAAIAGRTAPSSCAPPLPGFFRGLSCGIEFKGGIAVEAPIRDSSELAELSELDIIAEVRESLEPLGAADAQIQVAEAEDGTRSVIVQTSAVGEAESQEAVADEVRGITGASIAESPTERIGRTWGGEITSKAIKALLIFLLGITAFISWRFEWKMAVGAMTALLHDLTITAGVYAIAGFEVTPSTVIAILTILGYSLYDTVVVFDKVEEDTRLFAATAKMTYADAANKALNTVFMRSLNTTLSTILPVGALLFVGSGLAGAGTLADLALALFVGLLVGAYSSIFLATPILSLLKEREPRYQNIKAKVLANAKRDATKAQPDEASGDGADTTTTAGTVTGSAPSVRQTSKPPSRARAGSKKAKRRKRR